MINPFINGNPVRSTDFYGRKSEIRRLVSRILSSQSTAIVGEPRCGKTSIFLYLEDLFNSKQPPKSKYKRIFISYIDVYSLSSTLTQAEFWEHALKDVYNEIIEPDPDYSLAESYYTCNSNHFQTQVLENFLKVFEKNGYQLVLMLDEVDSLVHHKILNSAEFFGSLRSLSSRINSLSILTASRQSITSLNTATQSLNPTGSPYFNIFDEITLGPLAKIAIDDILNLGNDVFTPQDKLFIKKLSGAHPYLLQSASSKLWELYLDGDSQSDEKRLEHLHDKLMITANQMLFHTWKLWSAHSKMAMTTIALSQAPDLVLTHRFDNRESFYNINNLKQELKTLESQGFIKKDTNSSIGWIIRPQIFVFWVTEEITRTVRNKSKFDGWLREQEWEGILTKKEKDKLSKLGSYFSSTIKELPKVLVGSIFE